VNGWTLAGTTFVACAVEAVEAMTIVLAVGVARSWPISLRGAAYALAVLALIVAVFGPALHLIPIDQLKLIVGIVLTLFGLSWLRKAILRYAGRKALRDEEAAFARQVESLRTADDVQADRVAFITSFKAVKVSKSRLSSSRLEPRPPSRSDGRQPGRSPQFSSLLPQGLRCGRPHRAFRRTR
jgi:uncharacterized membrane protein